MGQKTNPIGNRLGIIRGWESNDIDYALTEALTVYGKIGIKVWICKGEVLGKRDLSPNVGVDSKDKGGRRGGDRRGGRGGDRRNQRRN